MYHEIQSIENGREDLSSIPTPITADLHVHSYYSDGAHSPCTVVDKCHAKGITTIALADHDHVGGIEEAADYAGKIGMGVVPAVELSSILNGHEIHILGYFIDPSSTRLKEHLKLFRDARLQRAEGIVKKLNMLHVPLTMESVLKQTGNGAIGRPHIANAMVDEGFVDSYQAAFAQYLGSHAPAYAEKYRLSPSDAIELISSSGGLSFIAHPGKYATDAIVRELIGYGLDGIEVVHPSHSEAQTNAYRNLSSQYFLLESGGSDYHGGKKHDDEQLGLFNVSLRIVEEMRKRLYSR
ncbi:MAG: PHP domain-containing protein [Bacteroidota bacterium]